MMETMAGPVMSKGRIKRRNAEQDRRFEQIKKLRATIFWEGDVNRHTFARWEDLAADSEDEELAAAMLHCLEHLRAQINQLRARKSMERRLEQLNTF